MPIVAGAFAIAAGAALKPFGDVFPPELIRHHFAGQDDDRGVYAKEVHIPAGWTLASHAHHYDHLSILSSGMARLKIDGVTKLVQGPHAIVMPKGSQHELYAITTCVWFCVHPTNETDPGKVDEVILTKEAR